MAWAAGGVAVLAAVIVLAVSGGGDDPEGRADPTMSGSCPSGFPLKANEASGIFHSPGQQFYDKTRAEACFADAAAARAAGFRASRV